AALRYFLYPPTYERWISQFDTLSEEMRENMRSDIARWDTRPLISVLMAVGKTTEHHKLGSALQSLERPLYPCWELCAGYDPSASDNLKQQLSCFGRKNGNVRLTSLAENVPSTAGQLNRALSLASGSLIALMSADAELSEDALYWVAKEVIANVTV